MSRGPGRVEREIEKLLHEHPDADFTVSEIARHVYGSVTTAQSRAVRRALVSVLARHPNWIFGNLKTRRNHPFGPGGDENVLQNRDSKKSGSVMAERIQSLSGAQASIEKYFKRP